MNYEILENYSKEKEPTKYEKSYAWRTAIGLQDVDALKPSPYLIETAKSNIEGDITLEEAQKLIHTYYNEKSDMTVETEEADKVSVRIATLLSEKSFVFSPIQYLSIHKKLFEGIYDHAGKIRDYNISKEEWVLNGDTVIYGSASNLNETLEYDLEKEKNFSYKGLNKEEIIKHLSRFVADLWQIHVFGEGNTRTTAVFLIKYLNKLGFDVTNDTFEKHSWYFRNALVRANYNNVSKGIYETIYYLELFFRNLLLGENNELSNREMNVSYQGVQEKLVSNELSENERNVLNVLKENGKLTLEEVRVKIGKSLRTVKSVIKSLTMKNLIERVGSKKSGYWKVL